MCKIIIFFLLFTINSYGSYKVFSEFLRNNCLKCHDEDVSKGDLRLDNLTPGSGDFALILKKVHRAVESRQMPPKKSLNPAKKEYFLKMVSNYLSKKESTTQKVNGRSTFRRLTNEEYQNSLRSVFKSPGLYLDPILPEDENGKHFTKNHHSLNISSVHLKSYLDAAERVLNSSYHPWEKPRVINQKLHFVDPKKNTPIDKVNGFFRVAIPFKKSGGGHNHPLNFKMGISGSFKLKFKARVTGLKESHYLELSRSFYDYAYSRKRKLESSYVKVPLEKWQSFTLHIDLQRYETLNFRIPESISSTDKAVIELDDISLEGPDIQIWPPAAHSMFWGDLKNAKYTRLRSGWVYRTKAPKDPVKYVEARLKLIMPKLFRRNVQNLEAKTYVDFYKNQRESGYSFHEALKNTYKAVLVSPHFLFKNEYSLTLGGSSVAERLAYFLWNSPPDEQLQQLGLSNRILTKSYHRRPISSKILASS